MWSNASTRIGSTHAAPGRLEVRRGVLAVAEREQALAELALVEAGPPVGDDRLEGTGDAGSPDHLAGLARPGRPPQVAGARNVGQDRHRRSEHRRRGEAVARRSRSPARAPGRGGARPKRSCRASQPSTQPGTVTERMSRWNGISSSTLGAQAGGVGSGTGAPRGVEGRRGRVVARHQGEQVAAHPAQVRHGDREHRVGGDRGVGRAAAVAQHAQSGLRREVVDRGHHRRGARSAS